MADKTPQEKPTAARAAAPGRTPATEDTATLEAYGFDRMTAMGTAWMDMLNQMGGEVMGFVADRIREDLKTQHRLLHCTDLAELQAIQSEFVQTAIEQYQAETGKLVEMTRNLSAAPKGKPDA